MTQLKKALERSDAYIEELESQVSKSQSGHPSQSPSSEQRQDGAGDSRSSQQDSTSIDPSDSLAFLPVPLSDEASGSQKDMTVNFAVPSTPPTPSSALSCLSLKSPLARREKKPSCSLVPYLRRLRFDDSSSSAFSLVEQALPKIPSNLLEQETSLSSASQSVWSRWEEPCSATFHSAKEKEENVSEGVSLAEEARMDAAFLNIVSELDSMMAEGESSRSHADTPRPPPDFDAASVSDLATDVPQTFDEPLKRKCPISLATSSPSKLSRIK